MAKGQSGMRLVWCAIGGGHRSAETESFVKLTVCWLPSCGLAFTDAKGMRQVANYETLRGNTPALLLALLDDQEEKAVPLTVTALGAT